MSSIEWHEQSLRLEATIDKGDKMRRLIVELLGWEILRKECSAIPLLLCQRKTVRRGEAEPTGCSKSDRCSLQRSKGSTDAPIRRMKTS